MFGVALEERYAGAAIATARSLVELRQLGLLSRTGLHDHEAVVGKDGRQVAGKPGLQGGKHLVGRVDQHEIVAAARGRLGGESPESLVRDDAGAGEAELVEIAVDGAERLSVGLDEDGARGASRERLEAHRAGAGEEVEDGRAVDGTDQVEGRLAGTVRGRTRVMSLRGKDSRALVGAGDDSHSRLTSKSCRADMSVDEKSRFCCSCTGRWRQSEWTVHSNCATVTPAIFHGGTVPEGDCPSNRLRRRARLMGEQSPS